MKKTGIVSALAVILFLGLLTGWVVLKSRNARALSPGDASAASLRSPESFQKSVKEDRELLRGLLELEEDDGTEDMNEGGEDPAFLTGVAETK